MTGQVAARDTRTALPAVNLMKGGVVYANFVTTVSPSHAGEARFGHGGFGLDRALQVHQVKFVLLGDANHHDGIKSHFWHLKHHLNSNPDCHLEIGYREELAHLVYAGADLLVVPSLFEPCGLAPMTAMRYGTVPVVRAAGGMIDTVFDRDFSARPPAERNGYVFHQDDNHAIESALDRALGLWLGYPAEFRQLMGASMRSDYSWARPGQDYINIYDYIRHK